ncbi:MAG: hypothetical protein ACHP8A_17220, partial [Terriglobales bacterium]
SSQTYSYSQFCDNYRRFAKQLKRSMCQIHRAGEKLFIDFAGPRLRKSLGFRCPAELFTPDGRQHHAALFALGH